MASISQIIPFKNVKAGYPKIKRIIDLSFPSKTILTNIPIIIRLNNDKMIRCILLDSVN